MKENPTQYDYRFAEADHTGGKKTDGSPKPIKLLLGVGLLLYCVSWALGALASGAWFSLIFTGPFVIAAVRLLREGTGRQKGRHGGMRPHTDDCCQHRDYSGMDPIQREYYEQYDSFHHNRYYGTPELRPDRKTRCPHCGRLVKDEYEYCPKCGSRLL